MWVSLGKLLALASPDAPLSLCMITSSRVSHSSYLLRTEVHDFLYLSAKFSLAQHSLCPDQATQTVWLCL